MKRFRCVDDVLDFAIAREIEAHRFYVELAQWAERPEVARAFEDFSVDELTHKMRLEAIKAGEVAFEEDEVGSLGIADKIEAAEPKANLSYSEALVVGMQREKDAFRLYTGLASIVHEPDVKDVFSKLAREEAGHKLRLEIEYDLTTF
ncbi:MAG: ferritin-like domain-containing protein [Planctomycetota bacterium]|jgi:rubrerythrin